MALALVGLGHLVLFALLSGVLGSLVPVLGWLLLVPGYLVFAFRVRRQLQRRTVPAVRWLGYRIWSRLAARTSLSVADRSS